MYFVNLFHIAQGLHFCMFVRRCSKVHKGALAVEAADVNFLSFSIKIPSGNTCGYTPRCMIPPGFVSLEHIRGTLYVTPLVTVLETPSFP